MKAIVLLFPIVILLVCQISDVEATNSTTVTKYFGQACDHTQVSECTNQTAIIHDKDKQIAELQITEILSLSVALVFGGIAIYSEIKRRKSDKKLKDFISNQTDTILNVIYDKRDEKQTPKVSGSMNFDFSGFLLEYTRRFLLKRNDIVNFSISILILSIAMIAVISSMYSGIHNDQIMSIILDLALAIILYVIIKTIFDLVGSMKKNNALILKIEKKIIRNYDYINGKSDDEKDRTLEEFHRVFTEKEDPEKLLEEHLSEPSNN